MGAARRAAEAATAALEARDYDRLRSLLADDFTFEDPQSPNPPMDADQWLDANWALTEAFPDFSYNFEVIREEGNQAWVRNRMEGTHTGDWDLSAMGMGIIPASDRWISTSPSVSRGTVNQNGKIERIVVVEQDEEAGMLSILRKIGVDLG